MFAVIEHIRHKFTPYDKLLMRGVDRHEARMKVSDAIDTILEKWETMDTEAPRGIT